MTGPGWTFAATLRTTRAMRLFLLTLLAMLAFAANSLLNRVALANDLADPISFGIVRLWSGAAILVVLVVLRRWRQRSRIKRQSGAGSRIAGTLSLFVYIFGFSAAYGVLDAGLGALILFGTVQITMFAAALWAREVMPPQRVIGAGLAVAGLAWLLWPGSATTPSVLHASLMVAAGLGWGVYSLIGRRAGDPLGDTGANFVGAGVLGLCLLPLIPAQIDGVTPTASGIMLAITSGAVTSALGYALWYQILPALGAARAAVAQLSVPVIAIFAGAVMLGEPLTWTLVSAAFVVLSGVALGLSPARR